VWKRRDRPIVCADHSPCGDERIDDGLLGCLHHCGEHGVHLPALHALNRGVLVGEGMLGAVALVGSRVSGRKCEEDVAGLVSFNGSDSSQADGDAAGKAFQLQTQISLWALGAAPLILGVDLTHLDPTDLKKYLENSEVLAVDQDSIAAKRMLKTGNQQVFAKREPNGDAIVGLFNTGEKAEEVFVPASTEALPENKSGYSLHDLWTGEAKKTSTISAVVPSHGVVLYRVSGL
jgi:Alpha galactosidase C-terminal beta sandwich domain/Alpha galactosidase A